MRGGTRRWTALFVGLITTATTLMGLGGTASANHWGGRTYEMQPFAGSFGAGPGTNLSMSPTVMATFRDTVYFVDDDYSVIRSLDMTTGDTRVVVGNEEIPPGDPYGSGCPSSPRSGRAGEVQLCYPDEIAVDPVTGDLYFHEIRYGTVRKAEAIDGAVTKDSPVTVVAGGGSVRGLTEEGGAARQAELLDVDGLAVDREGRLFISEWTMDRVRMVETDGQIWTVAGMRLVADHRGIGHVSVDPEGCVETDLVRGVTPYRTCLPGIIGIERPGGLALDRDGSVLVADFGNDRIIRLVEEILPVQHSTNSPTGQPVPEAIWHVEAMEGAIGLNGPFELAATTSGDIYARTREDTVVRVGASGASEVYSPPEDDNFIELVSIGSYGDTLLTSEFGETFDEEQWRYVRSQDGIYAIGADGGRTRLTGNDRRFFGGDGGAAPDAQMNMVTDVVYDNYGSFYLVDHHNESLRKVDCHGVIQSVYTVGTHPDFGYLGDIPITADQHGNIFLRDFFNDESKNDTPGSRLVKLAPDGTSTTLVSPWPGVEMATDQPDLYGEWYIGRADVAGMTIDETGRIWFTSEAQVFRYDPSAPEGDQYDLIAGNGSWGFRGDNGPAKLAELYDPRGLTFDGEGNLFIADTGNDRVRRWDAHSREITTVVGTDSGEMLDRLAQGDTSHVGGDRGEDTFLNEPTDVAYDTATDELWVLDGGSGRVLQAHRNRVTEAPASDPELFTVNDILDAEVTVGPSGGGVRIGPRRNSLAGSRGITLGDAGSVVVADTDRSRAVAITTGEAPVGACKEPPVEVTETALTVSAPAQGQHSDAIEATATLLDADGAPLAGRAVEFSMGEQVVTAETDAQGVARGVVALAEAPGLHKLTASFLGEKTYSGSIAETHVEIVREISSPSYVGDTQATSDQVRLAAQLSDDDGAAVAGREIVFTVAGQTFTAITNGSGLAETVVQLAKYKKSEEVVVTFAGDGSYEGGSSTATITWNKAKP